MKKLASALSIIALSVLQADANASAVELNFDAKFTYGVFHTLAPISLPVETSLTLSFELSSAQQINTYAGTTSKSIVSDARFVFADSPVFSLLPAPHISWDAGPTDSSVLIQRNDSTGMYRLGASKSLSYSLNCVLQCTHYFKAISLVSDYVVAVNYDPFQDPLRFIQTLQSSNAVFESSVIQDSWQRLSRRDIYAGASLSTSIDTVGNGSRWQGGGAWITNAVSPVPEPGSAALAFCSLCIVAVARKLGRGA